MSVFSSLISYRPKRKGRHGLLKISSPFHPSKPLAPPTHLHPQVLDIYDHRDIPTISSNPVPTSNFQHSDIPRVQLDVSVDAEPLTDWFSAKFLERKSEERNNALCDQMNSNADSQSYRSGHVATRCESRIDDNDDWISKEGLPSIYQVTNSGYDPEEVHALTRKHIPSPIMVSREGFEPRIQIVGAHSRPSSMISTSASSIMSGTSLARALIANSFVLCDTRSSHYRSGTSMLARADSATLPQADFPSSDRRERSSRSSFSSIHSPPPPLRHIPPVPNNAGQVYEPPKSLRISPEPAKYHLSLSRLSRHKYENEEQKILIGSRQSDGFRIGNELNDPLKTVESDSRLCHLVKYSPHEVAHPGSTRSTPEIKMQSTNVTMRPISDIKSGSDSIRFDLESGESNLSVLEYYASLGDSSSPESIYGGFRLPFSPITEESPSQLAPPKSFDNQLRPGLFFIGRSSSNGTDLHHRHISDVAPITAPLLHISNEQPDSVRLSNSDKDDVATIKSLNITYSLPVTSDLSPSENTYLLPPRIPTSYNDKSGCNTPSPIKLVPDPQNPRAYHITVSPTSYAFDDGRIFAISENELFQTLPKSPSVFSAPCSPVPTTPEYGNSMYTDGDIVPKATDPPRTSLSEPLKSNVTQQMMLISPVTTSVQNSILSRTSSSFPGNQTLENCNPIKSSNLSFKNEERSGQASDPPTALYGNGDADYSRDTSHFAYPVETSHHVSTSSVPLDAEPRFLLVHEEIPPTPEASPYGSTSGDESSLGSPMHTPLPSGGLLAQRSPFNFSETTVVKALPPIPLLRRREDASGENFLSQDFRDFGVMVQDSETRTVSEEPFGIDNNIPFTIASVAHTILQSTTVPETLQPLSSALSYSDDSSAPSLPPPYDTVIAAERPGTNVSATSLSNSITDRNSNDQLPHNGQGSPSIIRRSRTRPAGPRQPSQQQFPGWPKFFRERSGSTTSLASSPPSIAQRRRRNPSPSLKFETPAVRFRSYSLDAAKWTFTSSQLQEIVSRAIKNSADPSWIRLFSLDTLDNEIPDILKQLESQTNDVKNKYKVFSRRRHNIIESIAGNLDAIDAGTSTTGRAVSLIDDLRDVSATLDILAEELNSLNEQHFQISQFCERHNTSALAMALRKLNDSFLRKHTEVQSLSQRVEELAAERDVAWRSAELVASQHDLLHTESPISTSDDRSGLVSALRKKSLRTTKAGLRPRSQRSSIESFQCCSPSLPSGSNHEDMSSLPSDRRPLSRRRPLEFMTSISQRSSTGISTIATPSSETKAMLRAQDDLYEMLGINSENMGNSLHLRRSRSMIGIRNDWEQPTLPVSRSHSHSDDHTLPPISGRLSLPSSPTQVETYANIARDINALLTSERSPHWV